MIDHSAQPASSPLFKRVLKRASQQTFAMTGRHRWRRKSPQLLIITYHRVLPALHPDRWLEQPGMIIEPDTLNMHIETLREYFELVDMTEWLEACDRGEPLPPMACAITFDDGWKDNFVHGFPILKATATPATIFLVTDFVGTNRRFWPNRLQRLLTQESTAHQLIRRLRDADVAVTGSGSANGIHARETLIAACKEKPDSEIGEILDAVEAESACPDNEPDLLDWQDVEAMESTGIIRFGSHGATHTRLLPTLDADVMHREVRESESVLKQKLSRPAPIFCYPNGDNTAQAEQSVRNLYFGAVLTSSGWNDAQSDRYTLRRISVHNDVAYDRTSFLGRIGAWL